MMFHEFSRQRWQVVASWSSRIKGFWVATNRCTAASFGAHERCTAPMEFILGRPIDTSFALATIAQWGLLELDHSGITMAPLKAASSHMWDIISFESRNKEVILNLYIKEQRLMHCPRRNRNIGLDWWRLMPPLESYIRWFTIIPSLVDALSTFIWEWPVASLRKLRTTWTTCVSWNTTNFWMSSAVTTRFWMLA